MRRGFIFAFSLLLGLIVWAVLTPYTRAALQLIDFTVSVACHNKILLMWDTANEIDTKGFNLWRSEKEGEYTRINPSLIKAKGGIGLYSDYYYIDDTGKPEVVYYYKLEVMDAIGISMFYGPYRNLISTEESDQEFSSSIGCFLRSVR